MGIVLRQSFKYTIISAAGSLIGAFSVLFIYPLSLENYGLSQAITNFGIFLVPFLGFGTNSLVINYFDNRKKNSNNILISGLILSAFYIFIFLAIYFFVIKSNIEYLNKWGFNPAIFQEHSFYILGIGITLVLISNLINQCNNMHRVVIPNLLNNVGIKVFTPVIILACYFGYLNSNQIPASLLGFYLALFICLIWYLKSLNGLPTKILKQDFSFIRNKQVIKYSLITGLTGIAGILATKIDIISIAGIKNLNDVGKYSLPYFMASLIEIPLGGIASISAPLIANHLKKNELSELDILLKKASNSLFLTGIIIFTILYAIFFDLTALSKKNEVFQNGLPIFVIIGLAKLFDMVTSLNTHTISYSKFYTFNLYFVIITAIFNVIFTFYFTLHFGIIGTAYSILFSTVLFNLLKFVAIKIKLNINPFSNSSLRILLIFGLQIVLIYFLRFTFAPIFNIGIKTAIVIILYLFWIRIFKPSDDIYELLFGKEGVLRNFRKFMKNLGF